jgi:hypothetical protein
MLKSSFVVINSVPNDCSTLTPFATCGDKRFECNDRQLLKKWISDDKLATYLSNSDISAQLWRIWRMWLQREFGWTPLV